MHQPVRAEQLRYAVAVDGVHAGSLRDTMDYRVISADAHLEVPCDHWAHRVAAEYRDRVPRRVRLANGGDAWVAENQPLRICGLEMSARRPGEELKPFGNTYEESPGAGPPQQRLDEMDQDGVDAE